ncbi:MAG: hypothetical protein IRZ05_10895 [Micromonosporaceae bacterium]|nr:hypothetical protein [Micromonosporaceae bacterium]
MLALLGVVLLLFANSALLKMVRDLQQALMELRSAGPAAFGGAEAMTVAQFAAGDGRPTYVLVVDAACPACRERAEDYSRLSAGADSSPGMDTGHLVVLTKDAVCRDWFSNAAVRVLLDPVLLGTVGVGVTPMLIKYDSDGTEQWRRVVGSQLDLHRFVGAAPPLDSSAAGRARSA